MRSQHTEKKHPWNIAEALIAIKDFQVNQPNLVPQELQTFSKSMARILEDIKQFQYEVSILIGPLEVKIQQANQKYAKTLEVLQANLEKLYKMLGQLYPKINEPNPALEKYESLLMHLNGCLNGTLRQVNDLRKRQNRAYQYDIVYEIGERLNAAVLPWNQAVDLVQGKLNTEGQKYADAGGWCFGYVMAWKDAIGKSNYPNSSFQVLDTMVHKEQRGQSHTRSKQKNSFEGYNLSDASLVDNILNNMQVDKIYRLSLFDKNAGHCLGVRKIPQTNEIEFVDPNYGTFLFPHAEAFKQWFPLLMFSYIGSGNQYESLNISEIGTQSINSKSVLHYHAKPPTSTPKYFEPGYAQMALRDLIPYKPSVNKMTENYKKIFLNAVETIIGLIKDEASLSEFKAELESKSKYRFIFYQRPLTDRFFGIASQTPAAEQIAVDWSATRTAGRIKELLDQQALLCKQDIDQTSTQDVSRKNNL